MTELEAKLYQVLMDRLAIVAPFRGIQITERQRHQLATDLAILTAKVLVDKNSMNYQGKK